MYSRDIYAPAVQFIAVIQKHGLLPELEFINRITNIKTDTENPAQIQNEAIQVH